MTGKADTRFANAVAVHPEPERFQDAAFAETIAWVAKVALKYADEYNGEVLISRGSDIECPDQGLFLHQARIARVALERAICSPEISPTLSALIAGGQVEEAFGEHPLGPPHALPVGFQDIPGAVEALQSLLASPNSPILNHFCEQVDSTDVGMNADATSDAPAGCSAMAYEGLRDNPGAPIQDLEKAREYLDREIARRKVGEA